MPTALPETEETTEPTTTVSTDELENVGSVDNLTYTNNVIGFTLTAPEGWVMKGSQDTYEYVVSTGMATDVETLKSMLKKQGIDYLCYGTVSPTSNQGILDNIVVQTMAGSLYSGMDIETIITSFTSLVSKQYTAIGATATMAEPVKYVIDGQDVYQVSVNVSVKNVVMNQEYLIFLRNDTLVYMSISSEKDSATLAEQFMDALSFQ